IEQALPSIADQVFSSSFRLPPQTDQAWVHEIAEPALLLRSAIVARDGDSDGVNLKQIGERAPKRGETNLERTRPEPGSQHRQELSDPGVLLQLNMFPLRIASGRSPRSEERLRWRQRTPHTFNHAGVRCNQ